MHKVWAVIRREFVERVRTRAFILSTLLFPLFMGAMVVLPGYLMSRSTGTRTIAFVDATSDDLGLRMVTALQAARIGKGEAARPRYAVTHLRAPNRSMAVRDSLLPMTGKSRRVEGGLDGILVVTDSTVTGGKAAYYGVNVASFDDMRDLEQTIRPMVIAQRLQGLGVDFAEVMKSVQGIDLRTMKVADGKLTNESGAATFILAYAMGFLLYFSLLIFGNQVMNSIVEEKNNRIVEVLASSLTPFQMMLGKVVGVGSVALLQIGIWAGTATFLTTNQAKIMSMLGAGGSGGLPMALPSMKLELLIVFLLFFSLGFLLFAAAYAAVGAMANTVQDAGQMQMPVMMFVLAGFFSVFALIRDPNGTAAQVLSYVPMMTPFVIPMRYSISPLPMTELLGSIAVTIVGMLAIVWLAARIYRVGILSYGKKATLRDMVRWIRTA
ncbi:MAG: ABC transporter permease [Gemmatimonadales bacterium]|nr:ABC transporter permease [Gemmatimonadales bacterium]